MSTKFVPQQRGCDFSQRRHYPNSGRKHNESNAETFSGDVAKKIPAARVSERARRSTPGRLVGRQPWQSAICSDHPI